MAVHDVNTQAEVYRIGADLKLASRAGILTDSMVNSATTNAGLVTAVQNAPLPANYSEVARARTVRALQRGADFGVLSNTVVNGASTVSALISACGTPSNYAAEPFL